MKCDGPVRRSLICRNVHFSQPVGGKLCRLYGMSVVKNQHVVNLLRLRWTCRIHRVVLESYFWWCRYDALSVSFYFRVNHLSSDASAWAPLRHRVYRAFWIASFASNMGTWVHEVGASWLMTSLDGSPEMVSAVRFSMSLPVLVLAIPAGVLADRVDRRRLLLVTQMMLLTTALLLTVLTATGYMSSWGLLAMTFIMGLGMVVHVPTWQASIPEIVPRAQLSRAIALGSISFNLARSFGPAIGGTLIASFGAWSAFAFNATSFAGVIAVLAFWKRKPTESTRGLSFRLSLIQGLRYVFRNLAMRHVMIGVMTFVIPASALWSLLPLVVRERLDWDARGFGLLVAAVGLGAVIAAVIMPPLTRRFGSDRAVFQAMLVFALGLGSLSQTNSCTIAIAAAIVMGIGWMITLTTFNTAAQVTLPRRLRARGMGCYLSAFAFSMSIGSILWGRLAGTTSLGFALLAAAIVLVGTSLLRLAFPIQTASTSQ